MANERITPDAVLRSPRRSSGQPPRQRPRVGPPLGSLPPASSFQRLARVHALLSAGDVSMAVALATSLFFSISPDAARGKVLLYLLVSVAPFAVIAPLIGPAVDRAVGGRKLIVQVTAIGRAAALALMIFHLDDLLLFPLAFTAMVLQKTYSVSKAALVPSVVRSHDELVEANSKLGVISGVVGALAAAPAAGLATISTKATLVFGMLIYLVAFAAARLLPRGIVASTPAKRKERDQLGNTSLILAASAMALIRASIGFLFFHLLFWMRVNKHGTFWVGMAIAASSLGALVGNIIAPIIRRRMREESMLIAALGCIAVAGVAAAIVGGVVPSVIVAAVVNLSSSVGRMAFDSIVQRDAPGANQGRAFAQFETKFQLSWVLAALIPVLFTLPGQVGLLVVGVIAVFAVVSYLAGAKALRTGQPLPPSLGTRARRTIASGAARRRRG